jgi:uncharacterized protein YdhG (YjbR/CyaY superfamily)
MNEDVYKLQETMKAKAKEALHARIQEVMSEEQDRFRELADEIGITSKGFIKDVYSVQAETLLAFAKWWVEYGLD